MFNTEKISKLIRQARIAKNMTQVALADEMGVSYQAVSNWERGNSIPDIGKIGQLCEVLDLDMEVLLGEEESKTINKVVNDTDDNKLTVEELVDLAPVIPPSQMKERFKKMHKDKESVNIASLIALAPFLSDEILDDMLSDYQTSNLRELVGLAPFLSDKTLGKLIMNNVCETSLYTNGILGLMPFLSEEVLDDLAKVLVAKPSELVAIAPFLSDSQLETIVSQSSQEEPLTMSQLQALAPFLSEKALKKVVMKTYE